MNNLLKNSNENNMMKSSKIAMMAICLFGFALTSMSFTNTETRITMETIEDCANAQFSTSNGMSSEASVVFQNESTNAVSYLWEFGDGTTSTDVNPQHLYRNAGMYTVKLTAFGGACTSEFIGTVDVIDM